MDERVSKEKKARFGIFIIAQDRRAASERIQKAHDECLIGI
jgi:hypothetical protein